MPLVYFIALTLEIGPEISANQRTLVPFEPEPAEAVVDGLHGFGCVARLIGILDAKDKRASNVMREKPVEKRGPRTANVEKAGGRWRKTDADSGTHFPEFESAITK